MLKIFLRRLKLTLFLYNFINRSGLKHNKKIYKKWGLKRSIFAPIHSNHFSTLDSKNKIPLIDEDSNILGERISGSNIKNQVIKDLIFQIHRNGYGVIKNGFSIEECTIINQEIDKIIKTNSADFRMSGKKVMYAYSQSKPIREIINSKIELQEIMDTMFGEYASLFQSINFIEGSEQAPHSDGIHMSTFPKGFLAAAWIALEPVNEDNGQLVYYPGSHKLPIVNCNDFDSGSTQLMIGKKANKQFEKKIGDVIKENDLKPEYFNAYTGDVLIWHGNLIHGGTPIKKLGSTRKSMVLHYMWKEAICYHELTQRPAIWK